MSSGGTDGVTAERHRPIGRHRHDRGDRMIRAGRRRPAPTAEGWIQDPNLGHGLFVEHEGESEAEVRDDIQATLASLRQGRGPVGDRLGDVQMVISGATCVDEPVSALVVAVFTAEAWPGVVN